jgi:hypothetical protein
MTAKWQTAVLFEINQIPGESDDSSFRFGTNCYKLNVSPLDNIGQVCKELLDGWPKKSGAPNPSILFRCHPTNSSILFTPIAHMIVSVLQ